MIRERRGVVQSLVTALVTKPFMLLSGISGSGKTQLARRIAAGIAAGMYEGNNFSGLSYSGEGTAQAFKMTLAKNGIVPEILGGNGGEYIDVREPEDAYTEAQLKSSNINDVLKYRIAFLPVRPDWTDPQKIWGYYNPLTGLYYPTPATLVALHAYLEFLAYGDAAPRHFIILDELNLARVEYYLADILSLMECPTTIIGDQIKMGEFSSVHPFNRPLWTVSAPKTEMGKEDSVHEQLYIGKMDRNWTLAYHYLSAANAGMMLGKMPINVQEIISGADWHRIIPPRISFTPNLTIIGTVNVDETTFSFSPKVLDRAFVMEFNEMDYERVCHDWKGFDDARQAFVTMHRILRPENLHFGYRTVREVLDYINQAQSSWAEQGDFCMASKILPKLRGGEDRLGSILPVFLAFALTNAHDFNILHETATALVADILEGRQLPGILKRMELEHAAYPLTADKLFRMTRQLLETGLASFF
ncbi:MAG: hypothetical protein IJU23_02885 [Proteobacteria bacterium]|nr:hypothetical protein [Pseudomonadota bacterium]